MLSRANGSLREPAAWVATSEPARRGQQEQPPCRGERGKQRREEPKERTRRRGGEGEGLCRGETGGTKGMSLTRRTTEAPTPKASARPL